MALIKMTPGKAHVGKLEKYLKDVEKTKESIKTGLNCNIKRLSYDFSDTKKMYNKTSGRRYYHVVQSFNPKDNISPEKAHKIGVKLAKKQFGDKGYEVGVFTHTDKKHIHNHIVINSVNAKTGKKFKSKGKDLWRIKKYSNKLAKENQLQNSIIDHSERKKSYNRGEYESFKRGQSWKADVILDVQEILKYKPKSMNEFIAKMEEKNYKIRYKESSKTMTFTTPKGKKVRGKTLTKSYEDLDYSKGVLENEIKRFRELSRKKTNEQSRIYGTDERNKEIERTDEKLHQRSNGQEYNQENDIEKGIKRYQRSFESNTKENDFDFERAEEYIKSEQQANEKDFGEWTDELEKQYKQGFDGNAIDRERVKQRNREIERTKQEKLKISRAKDIGLSR